MLSAVSYAVLNDGASFCASELLLPPSLLPALLLLLVKCQPVALCRMRRGLPYSKRPTAPQQFLLPLPLSLPASPLLLLSAATQRYSSSTETRTKERSQLQSRSTQAHSQRSQPFHSFGAGFCPLLKSYWLSKDKQRQKSQRCRAYPQTDLALTRHCGLAQGSRFVRSRCLRRWRCHGMLPPIRHNLTAAEALPLLVPGPIIVLHGTPDHQFWLG